MIFAVWEPILLKNKTPASQNDIISSDFENSLDEIKELNQIRYALDCSSIVAMTDVNGTIFYVNDRFCQISKYSQDELLGQNHRILKSDHHTQEFFKGMMNTISNGQIWRGDIKNKAKDGTFYWVDTTITPLLGLNGKPARYIAIRNDITERKNQEEQIRFFQREIIKQRKNIELKNKILDIELEKISKLEKQKEEFTSMMTHEFKTPLTPIISWSNLLTSKALGELNEKQLSALSMIDQNARHLSNLINDVLDVHKLELSQLKFNKTKCNSEEIIDELIETYSAVFDELKIKFSYSDIEHIPLITDLPRIQQILRIFITNALDFVPKENGEIKISVQTKNDSIIFSIIDNGIGISEKDQKQLFQKFFQVNTSATRKHGGSGLGLSVAKGITEGLGGEIGVTSSLNHGSTFFVKLPLNVKIIAQQ